MVDINDSFQSLINLSSLLGLIVTVDNPSHLQTLPYFYSFICSRFLLRSFLLEVSQNIIFLFQPFKWSIYSKCLLSPPFFATIPYFKFPSISPKPQVLSSCQNYSPYPHVLLLADSQKSTHFTFINSTWISNYHLRNYIYNLILQIYSDLTTEPQKIEI